MSDDLERQRVWVVQFRSESGNWSRLSAHTSRGKAWEEMRSWRDRWKNGPMNIARDRYRVVPYLPEAR